MLEVLGNQLHINLTNFPELEWLVSYLDSLRALESRRNQLTQSLEAIAKQGEIYREQWIEPYTKTKSGKSYTYYQLRWLTGERKPSGQPRIKTKHLSKKQLGEARAAIGRGQKIVAIERQCKDIDEEIFQLKRLAQKTGDKLQRMTAKNQIS